MGFKLLSYLFKFGGFIAATPSSLDIKKPNTSQKIYIILVFVLLTGCHFASLYYKHFFLNYIHIKVVLCFLDEASVHGLNFYCMITLGLYKTNKWKELIKNLHALTHLVHSKKESQDFLYFLGFLLVYLLHGASSGYVAYVGWKVYGVLYLKQELTDHVLIFLDLFYKTVMCVVIKMLLSRYEGLKLLLLDYIVAAKKHSKLPIEIMKKVEYTMGLLKKTTNIYNEMFAWPTFLIICFTTLEVLNSIDFAMFYNKELKLEDNMVLNALLLVWIFVDTVVLILMCDAVLLEGSSIVSLSHDLRWSFPDSEIMDDLKFEEFTSLLEKNMPQFTAANFFDVGRWTILSFLGTVITFLIVMIQFGN